MTDHDVPDARAIPPEGATRATPARMYNTYLQGKDNRTVDREATARLLEDIPDIAQAAAENREFVLRAVGHCAEAGVDQFLDLGAGLPTDRNVHEVAREKKPIARVVYVDNDPVVLAHGRALLADNGHTTVIVGDVRRPADVLKDPALRASIDLRRPVAVLLGAVLHFVRDDEHPHDIVAAFRDVLAPGSRLVLSHATDEGPPPEHVTILEEAYANATAQVTLRSRDAIAGFFDGFDLEDPGLTRPGLWRPAPVPGPSTHWQFAGVGRVQARGLR
ncbi:SAM-dependent methyltransferase (plasmid) [Embleya sp. NBC_00888]|uniref:SAM-dependent methyltransferase n=1 Tax=Embleya sp. NBC_00888 TaxID=2975960 RepID=UPI002F907AAE|nr:SAM-dependent methyltransferase [Embleya sp. NBC_00888]